MHEVISVERFQVRHHCGAAKLDSRYLNAQTHVVLHLEERRIAIPVGDIIKNIAGWYRMTAKRQQALLDTLPSGWSVQVKRTFNGGKWYSIDLSELTDWVERAIGAIS